MSVLVQDRFILHSTDRCSFWGMKENIWFRDGWDDGVGLGNIYLLCGLGVYMNIVTLCEIMVSYFGFCFVDYVCLLETV